jgi:hypothetical protein
MRVVKYKFVDDELSIEPMHPLLRDLLFPKERASIAVYDFALVCGFLWAILVALFTLMAANGSARSLVEYFAAIYPGYNLPPSPDVGDVIVNLGIGTFFGFVHGCLFGLLLGIFYNRLGRPSVGDIRFIDKTMPEGVPVMLVEKGNKAKLPAEPYTILIVANPILEYHSEPATFKIDPILSEPKLFQAKVALIINSLARSQVVRRFIRRMRFVALFDPALGRYDNVDLAKILAEDARGHYNESNKKIIQAAESRALCLEDDVDIIIEPLQRRANSRFPENDERLKKFLEQYYYRKVNGDHRVDIVFAVTASRTHVRSSSRYTMDEENGEAKSFVFRYYPKGPALTGRYWPRAALPGMVAYSAWDDRMKTPAHEFAHAMSSTNNGLIVDEYDDDLLIDPDERIVINKRHATWEMDENQDFIIQPSELPRVFAEYTENGETRQFLTDKHRKKPANWISFVPLPSEPEVPCTMDFTGDLCEYDRLLQHFMGQRLEAKVGKVA